MNLPSTPRAGLRPARPPRGSMKLGAARRFLESQRRALLKLAALSSLAASAALMGCGKKEEPAPAPASAAAPAAAPAAEPLKAAWVYVGPVGDAGWTYAHDMGRK